MARLESRPHLSAFLDRATANPMSVAVAYACDPITIRSVSAASAWGLIEPIVVGPRLRIESAALAAGICVDRWQIVETPDDPQIPMSRSNPQFNGETLAESLAAFGISYEHVVALGGRRGKLGLYLAMSTATGQTRAFTITRTMRFQALFVLVLIF